MPRIPRMIRDQPGPVRVSVGVPWRSPPVRRKACCGAEAFRCCHDVTPSMRVSAPVTLPKPSDKPARKPYKARASPASGLPDPQAMPSQAATTT